MKNFPESCQQFTETFELTELNISIKVTRIFQGENSLKNYKYIPITNNAYDSFSAHARKEPFLLPKLYVALAHLTGPNDEYCFDDWKGSYGFMFQLEVIKNGKPSLYVYIIYHYRSYIDFRLYQLVDSLEPGKSLDVMQPPEDDLFSNADICYFSAYFCGYALGYLKGYGYEPAPFVKGSDSNLLLFGYKKGKYFIKQFNSEDAYQKHKNAATPTTL